MEKLEHKNSQQYKFSKNSTERECAEALQRLQESGQIIKRFGHSFLIDRWQYINGAGRDFLVLFKEQFLKEYDVEIEFELKSSESGMIKHCQNYRTPCLVLTKKIAQSREETRKALIDFLSTCEAKTMKS